MLMRKDAAAFRMDGSRRPNALLRCRALRLRQLRTSVRLEEQLWQAYDEICIALDLSSDQLARRIDAARGPGVGLTAAVRVFLVGYFRFQFHHPAATADAAFAAGIAAIGFNGPEA